MEGVTNECAFLLLYAKYFTGSNCLYSLITEYVWLFNSRMDLKKDSKFYILSKLIFLMNLWLYFLDQKPFFLLQGRIFVPLRLWRCHRPVSGGCVVTSLSDYHCSVDYPLLGHDLGFFLSSGESLSSLSPGALRWSGHRAMAGYGPDH
jgi:hypothetical protein